MTLHETVRVELLGEAAESIDCPALDDTSARLALQNLIHGMAKVLFAIRKVDPRANARFFPSHDFTITRHPRRWASGFAYGGILDVQAGAPIVFPELRPNTCGTLVGALDSEMAPSHFMDRLAKVRRRFPGNEWDYGRKNHFVNIYRSEERGRQVFIIHGCPSQQKTDNDAGPGLHIDSSEHWATRVSTIETPIGNIRVLIDDDATEYWLNYKRCEENSKHSRMEIASAVFGEFELLSNETHEGMLSINRHISGCHAPGNYESCYPLMTTISHPAYIIRANREHSRNLPIGVAGILPHGTGYDLPMRADSIDVEYSTDGDLVFVLRHDRNNSVEFYRDFSHVPYNYRSPRLIAEWRNEGVFDIVDTLLPEVFSKF